MADNPDSSFGEHRNDDIQTGLSILQEALGNIAPYNFGERTVFLNRTVPGIEFRLILDDVEDSGKLGETENIDLNIKYMPEPGALIEIEATVDRGRLKDYREALTVFDGTKIVTLDFEMPEEIDLSFHQIEVEDVNQSFVLAAHLVARAMAA